MTLFRNKFRIESARLSYWDYSSPGYYFITLCAFDHRCIFGEILNNGMHLNENGEIVRQEWEKSFTLRRELKWDIYCIMPNHFHSIVRIVESDNHLGNKFVETHGHKNDVQIVETHGRASLLNKLGTQPPSGVGHRAPKSISSFIAGFKSVATKRINEHRKTPGVPVWQPRFHDHVIRDDRELYAIRQYINPSSTT
jgi:putative transposase